MNLNLVKAICSLQGIALNLNAKVRCLSCSTKTLMLDLEKNKGECNNCGKKYNSIEEVALIAEQEWLDKHGKTVSKMTERKGVKL